MIPTPILAEIEVAHGQLLHTVQVPCDAALMAQLIVDYGEWAQISAVTGDAYRARDRLIQIAALAVAGIDHLDRVVLPSLRPPHTTTPIPVAGPALTFAVTA